MIFIYMDQFAFVFKQRHEANNLAIHRGNFQRRKYAFADPSVEETSTQDRDRNSIDSFIIIHI
jgi:hypothetical protein